MKPFLTLPLLAFAVAPALADAPHVVVDIPAIGSLTQQVMGDLGQVRVLLPSGGDAHNYQIRPADAAAMQDADLLIWVGPELTPWLERAAANLSSGKSLELIEAPGTSLRDFAESDGTAGHHDHDHDHADHDGHDHDGIDPHAWLDPHNGIAWLDAIAATLSAKDPENAGVYARNAQAAAQTISRIDAENAQAFAAVADQRFVVFHDAFGYFTDHYGLPPAIALSLGDASSPSAARLSEIRQDIAGQGAVCAFPEAQHSPALLQSVIEGTGATLGRALDPSGSDLPYGPGLYGDILRNLGETISDCLAKNSDK